MLSVLQNIKKLVYRRSQLMEDVNTYKNGKILAKIDVNIEKQNVTFTNYTITKNDTSQFSQNYKGGLSERYNLFFPRDELYPYRIVGEESVSVSAGNFDCTVIEGLDGENKIRLWMITDKPGIYAKVITEAESMFGKRDYTVLELEKME